MGGVQMSASMNGVSLEFLKYGKYVTGAGGPVLFGREYSVTSHSPGLTDWKTQVLRPSGLLPGRRWAPDLIAPHAARLGCLIVIPVGHETAPGQSGVALARIRYRSESGETDSGEGKPGRIYLQSTAWFVSSEDWRQNTGAILAAAGERLRADPDIADSPLLQHATAISTDDTRPEIDEGALPEELARIIDRMLDSLEGKSSPPLALGIETFDNEAAFLAAAGEAVSWLSAIDGDPGGFASGLSGNIDDGLILRWIPGEHLPQQAAPAPARLKERRADLLRRRPKPRALFRPEEAAFWKKDVLGRAGVAYCNDELERFDKRCRDFAAAGRTVARSTPPVRRASAKPAEIRKPLPQEAAPAKEAVPVKEAAPVKTFHHDTAAQEQAQWRAALVHYEKWPSREMAGLLMRLVQEEFKERGLEVADLIPDSDGGLYKLVLIASQPAAANENPLRYVPFDIIDWGLHVAGSAASDQAFDLLKRKVVETIVSMGVLCPAEVTRIEERLPKLRELIAQTAELELTREASTLLRRVSKRNAPPEGGYNSTVLGLVQDRIRMRINRTLEDLDVCPAAGTKIIEEIQRQIVMLREIDDDLRLRVGTDVASNTGGGEISADA